MAEPRPGQRVRVTLEGVVGRETGQVGFPLMDPADPSRLLAHVQFPTAVEALPDPEPAWWPPQAGDVVTLGDAPGMPQRTWLATAGIWIDGTGYQLTHDDMLEQARKYGDARLLVRGGKPYTIDLDRIPERPEKLPGPELCDVCGSPTHTYLGHGDQ